MADLLTLNAVSKVQKDLGTVKDSLDGIRIYMDRPTHHTNVACIYSGCCCCGFCVPDTATEMIIEMWGQGGTGSAAFCCNNGYYGGQGGAYGVKTVDLTGQGFQCVTGCSCYNTARSRCCTGCDGRIGWLCNHTQGLNYTVTGGCGGASCCFWQAGAFCGSHNLKYNTDLVNGSCWGPSATGESCIHGNHIGTTNCVPTFNASADRSVLTVHDALNTIFPTIDCANFDEYRLGACGWSGSSTETTCRNSCNNSATGVGGAAYAGGAQQVERGNTGYNACGMCGNFPGGGGSGGGSSSSTNCYGGAGGPGLIIVSWN